MNINDFTKLTIAQLRALQEASKEYGEDTEIFLVLSATIDTLTDRLENELNQPVVNIPAGFNNQEEYTDFLREQLRVLGNNQNNANPYDEFEAEFGGQFDGNENDDALIEDLQTNQLIDVVGIVDDGQGGYKEIGSVEESTAKLDEMLAGVTRTVYDEDGNAHEEPVQLPATDHLFHVKYRRIDGQELTLADVDFILAHKYSEALKNFENIQMFAVEDGATPSEKTVVFLVLAEGKIKLQHLALGLVQYRGQRVFPGIGQVEAVGQVNFLEELDFGIGFGR
jgi:hypothetical protein